MPTHDARCPDVHDRSKLRRLLHQADRQLAHEEADHLSLRYPMSTAEALVDDHKFWTQQSLGLAVFLEPSRCAWFRVPLKVPESATTGTSFHLTPLLPLLEESARFYVLTVEGWRVQMWECTSETYIEYPIAAACESSSAGEIQRYFQKLSHRIALFVRSMPAPLLITGEGVPVNLLQSSLEDVGVASELVATDSAERCEVRLRQSASRQLQARADMLRADKLCSFTEGDREHNTTKHIELILPAAFLGRVETLFVASDAYLFGRYDMSDWAVHRHTSKLPEDQDLAALAAVMTYVHDGTLFIVDRRDMPGASDVAAILR
jgi:hypothetical protein